MLDASPKLRIVEHVDNGAVNIRYSDLGSSAPDGLRAKDHTLPDMLQGKVCAMALLVFRTHGTRCHHNNIAKDLLRQIPVFSGSPASNVGWLKERRHQHPGIIKNLLAGKRVKANRCVRTRTDTPQPALPAYPKANRESTNPKLIKSTL